MLLSILPELPGVYQFYDSNDQLLYIGKAKNLKRRVSSYFNKNHDTGKIRILVGKIETIRHIVVDTETEALLLENSLIKKHQPRYNVMLKDDKTYPWICIKKEHFPRVFPTRTLIKDGSEYFGPYGSVYAMKTLLELIKQLYHLRNCNLKLTRENIEQKKFRVCLEYHVGNCKGPCVGNQQEEEYLQTIEEIKNIIKGNLHSVTIYLKKMMNQYAEEYKYESAQQVKERIEVLEKFQSRSTVVNASLNNIDVFSFIDDENVAYVNFMKVMSGAIIQSHTIELKKRIEETKEDLLSMAIVELRNRFDSVSTEVLVPFDPDFSLDKISFTIPQRGDKKKLLDLSWRNAKYYQKEKLLQLEKINPHEKIQRVLETLKKDLRLVELPIHIECFDNSNIQGTNPVAACVVFKNSRPSKRDYRHFNIKSVVGSDDFSSMEEIVFRRYKRLLEEQKSLPQLIIIDGGKGQLSAAVNSLEKLKMRGKIAIVGIAKKLEEIYFPDDSIPLYLNKNSESLKLIQQLRNEAHRFGISFHRDKRSKAFIVSELDEIKGIGPKIKQKLFDHFKTIENIKAASLEELGNVIGKAKAEIANVFFK